MAALLRRSVARQPAGGDPTGTEPREDRVALLEWQPTDPCDGHLVAFAAGEIDLATADTLRQLLADAADEGCALVVLDLSSVVFLDSTGLGVIVGEHQRLTAAGRRLVLAAPMANVLRVLTITGLEQAIPVFDTLAEAVADCGIPHLLTDR